MRSFAEFIGQGEAVRRLKRLVELAQRSQTALPHILLVGPEGSGKRTIAHVIAREMGVNVEEAQAAAFERVADLAAAINDLDKSGILLLQNVKRLNKLTEKILPHALKDFELHIVVGKGPDARHVKLAMRPFTLIGTVQKQSDCPSFLLRCFDAVIQLQRYGESELVELIERFANTEGISLDTSAAAFVARQADGNPNHAESLVHRLRLVEKQPVTEHDAREILSVFGHGSGNRAITSGIDLSSLSGVEFERLVTTVLSGMGFVAEMTKTSGDGGIDIEAVLNRPIVGGRYLFQCKRFAPDNLVGSPTIREFYGAVVADRKAVKGILITTSGFTPQAREFAENLPIELIDGDQLDRLLSDNVGRNREKEGS